MEELFKMVAATPEMRRARQRVEAGGAFALWGVAGAAQPFLAALLHRLFPERRLVVVTEGVKAQELFQQDVETLLGPKESRPLFYPAWEILPSDTRLPHADVISERLETLVALSDKGKTRGRMVVTSVAALLQKTFPPEEIGKRSRLLKRGDTINPLDLVEWLEEQGYEPEAQVTNKGEISLRGGILDIYPLTSPWPVRLEFFGDELDSLRFFDPHTQVSRETIDSASVSPAGELGFLKRRLEKPEGSGEPRLASLLEYLEEDSILFFCDLGFLEDHARGYASQLNPGDPFFLGWEQFMEQAERLTSVNVLEGAPDEEGSDFPAPPPSGEGEETDAGIVARFSSMEAFRPVAEKAAEPQVVEALRREFFGQLHRWMRQDYSVHVFCNNDGERQRFQEIWREQGLGQAETGSRRDNPLPRLHLGALSRGFINDAAKVAMVTDAEIFGRYKVQRARRLKSPHAAASRSALDIDFSELEEGDYVVHLQHGIGRFLGIKLFPAGSGKKGSAPTPAAGADSGQECLVIEYAAGEPGTVAPKLYVPITEAHLVGKYVGTGKGRPALNTLGGTRWTKTKAQAEEAVRDVAAELLSIQAARESLPGHAFPADTPWQREFESAFLYEETPDQMKAIVDAKKDLESPRPMDRLICGDVGYGKTEVAIRAAFKAVMGGKQVAILVPTTILAQQHFNNFRERMADYPVRVEQLSRFRTKGEQRKILRCVAEGSVDIVVGTHRLIQEDVVFKDLGLVVIDEEQRFGVMHKEKFKLLRKMVDVLTLSATPIPRTLYLALTGARDMSTIETPPQDRLPVETVVAQYDERIIRDAVRRELNRGGQVYYLHNRVMDIHSVALRVSTLVPDARVIVGHGQMDSDDLEDVMGKFINGEADVLVSTTIIESGIDIPNANTIIIDRADRFGLSDLYQLRGRVGRYKHQAYAYLLLPRHAALLTDVRKRISAIKQYSSLGSGFKIAMRDLEIRGAGNLLGSQQSGHITAVGFDLYCQLLKQTVSALKGEKVQKRIETLARIDFLALNPGEESFEEEEKPKRKKEEDFQISVPRETATYSGKKEKKPRELAPSEPLPREAAYIPMCYVSEPKHRFEIYRKLAQVTDKAGLEQLKAEMRDRFGRIPGQVELLFQMADLKILASDKGVMILETKEDKLMLTRNNDYIMVGGKFPRLTKRDAKGRLNEIKRLLLSL